MSRITEASMNLRGELAVDTWWEEREEKHWPASFPACLWNCFLWGIFLMSDKWQWQDRIVLEAGNGAKCWQKPGLWKSTFEQLRAPLATQGHPSFCCYSSDSPGYQGKCNGWFLQNNAHLLNVKYQIFWDTVDNFVKLLWIGSPTETSWSFVPGLGVQQNHVVLRWC